MRITYSPDAIADLERIADYLTPRSPQGALNVRHAITATIMHLARHPRIGRLQTADGVRKIVTRKYYYRIYYTIDEAADELIIANILHGARSTGYSDT